MCGEDLSNIEHDRDGHKKVTALRICHIWLSLYFVKALGRLSMGRGFEGALRYWSEMTRAAIELKVPNRCGHASDCLHSEKQRGPGLKGTKQGS